MKCLRHKVSVFCTQIYTKCLLYNETDAAFTNMVYLNWGHKWPGKHFTLGVNTHPSHRWPTFNRRSKSSMIYGRDLYLLKPELGPPKRFRHLTRAEEVVITRLRVGHTKATKYNILSRGPPIAYQHCGQTLTIEHILLECIKLQQIRDEYYTVDSLRTSLRRSPEAYIIISERSWILLYDMNGHISSTTIYSNQLSTGDILKFN